MIDRLHLIGLHANAVPAEERARYAALAETALAGSAPADGSLLLQTCHRVEIYGSASPSLAALADLAPPGAAMLSGLSAARHLVRLAVGLESAVVAEDQVLHQLRRAMSQARARGPLPASLDRLLDIALRSGRRARSWLPPTPRGLAELAVRRALGEGRPTRAVLLVGAGEMGRRLAWALHRRGIAPLVTSRTPERAAALAAELDLRTVPFAIQATTAADVGGAFVALAGQWPLDDAAAAALEGAEFVVDLSSPPAFEPAVRRRLGARLTTVDDLAAGAETPPSERLLRRLDELVAAALDDWQRWSDRSGQRALAWELSERASQAQAAELVALWRRVPDLDPQQRREVERMARHLAERLLREPLEQLAEDRDGQRAQAARELFRL